MLVMSQIIIPLRDSQPKNKSGARRLIQTQPTAGDSQVECSEQDTSQLVNDRHHSTLKNLESIWNCVDFARCWGEQSHAITYPHVQCARYIFLLAKKRLGVLRPRHYREKRQQNRRWYVACISQPHIL